MEVALSQGQQGPFFANAVKTDTPAPASPQNAREPFSIQAVENKQKNGLAEQGEGNLKELLERTVYLMEAFDRSVKYELKEDAGVYQLQVIDMSDGRVVRKIPPDEVLRILEHLKEQLDDHVDVLA